jgi:hypothetical protein
MDDTFLVEAVEPMPWKGVAVIEQRQRFLEDYQHNYSSIAELAERFPISRKTAYTWINRCKQNVHSGFHERSHEPGEEGMNEDRDWRFYQHAALNEQGVRNLMHTPPLIGFGLMEVTYSSGAMASIAGRKRPS